jgi:HEAT repeats/PBS lyase HEAT-like repeat
MDTSAQINEVESFAPVLVREIEAAIKRFNMYPADHPASKSAAEIPYKTLKSAMHDDSQVILSIIEGKLGVNGKSLENIQGKSVLLETLTALNLSSISFGGDLSLKDFQTLLKYFIGKTGGKIEWNDLEEYLDSNSIIGVSVDEFRYELIGKDQTVVDENAVLGGEGGGVSISSIFGDHPDLILGLLANKNSAREGISEEYAHAIDYEKLSDGLHEEMGNLSDSQIMNIIAAGLQNNIKDSGEYDEVDVQETLHNITEILEKRNQADLLPKVKKIAEELNLIDDRYLDMILDKKFSRKRLAYNELETAKEGLELGAHSVGTYNMIPKRLEIYGDDDYTKSYINNLFDSINEMGDNWNVVSEGLGQIVDGAVESDCSKCLDELYGQIKVNLSRFDLDDSCFELYLREAAKMIEWLSIEENLPKLIELFDVISVYTSKELVTSVDKRQFALDFYEQIGTNELTSNLYKQLEKKFEVNNRLTFDILKHMQTQTVALKLCDYISYPERSIRLFNIRILSELGIWAARAFQLTVTDLKLTERPAGEKILPEESWYKLRNIIMICGNIASPESIEILEGFLSDPDPRLAEEMIKALEKIKSEKACVMLTSYVYFDDSKVRLRAANALAAIGDDAYLSVVIDAFTREKENKAQLIPIIARLGQEKALPFFRNLLFGQKESLLKSFLGMSSDDLKIQILSALNKIPSKKALKLLDEYKSTIGGGFGSLFRSNKVLVAVENTRRSMQLKISKK